jgi:diguanylate cyclase (GGDEF)-like protein/PAS domain S-box-containing protein
VTEAVDAVDETLEQFRAELAAAPDEAYELTLYVSGASDLSTRAIADARQLCETYLAGKYLLSVVDVNEDTAVLRTNRVMATPTLVKNWPLPARRLVGDLSECHDGTTPSMGVPGSRPGRNSLDRLPPMPETSPALDRLFGREDGPDAGRDEIPEAVVGSGTQSTPSSSGPARITDADAVELFRAIGAGEVDAFVVSDAAGGQQVFTLSTADRPYRMFVENMRDGAATVSSGGVILYANRRLAEMLSCARETIVGSPLARWMTGAVPTALDEIRGPAGLGTIVEFDLLDADGRSIPFRVGSAPLELDGDRLVCLTFTDLSAQKTQDREITRLGEVQAERVADLEVAQAALTQQATHDALTGLPNRALLVDRIDQALTRSKRSGRCTAVFFVDLDRFKHINDTQGHAAGDAVLRSVAKQLELLLRPMDTVARIGGDEFVVLAPDVDSRLHAVDIANRLLIELSRSSDEAADSEPVAASIGISVSVGGRGTAEILLKEADTAMYEAKSLGRGRAEVFDEALRSQVQERLTAQMMLQSALDDRRLIAYYQPIIDLSTGIVAGFEALARLVQGDGSILPPAAFMPVAEDSGLVVPLGTQMLEMACREACSWRPSGLTPSPLTVAVNLSACQFETGDLPALVRGALEETGLDPGKLHLELIETAIIDLRPDILQQLGRLRDLGVEIGLDDFGTGYASLTHLRRLPLTFVKIDRSFVSGIETDHEDDRIVSAVVDLAANLGLRSVAEGIETQIQLDRLRELGCDQAQGYLFARPLPPADVPEAIQHPAW